MLSKILVISATDSLSWFQIRRSLEIVHAREAEDRQSLRSQHAGGLKYWTMLLGAVSVLVFLLLNALGYTGKPLA